MSQSRLPRLLPLLSGSLLRSSRSSEPARRRGQAGCPHGVVPLNWPSEHFSASFSGGLDPKAAPDTGRYLLTGISGRSADPSVAIFPAESPLRTALKTNPAPYAASGSRKLAPPPHCTASVAFKRTQKFQIINGLRTWRPHFKSDLQTCEIVITIATYDLSQR